jgi:hypothetical protein
MLLYEVEFSKFLLSGSIGQIKLYIAADRQDQDGSEKQIVTEPTRASATAKTVAAPSIEFRAEAVSKGFFTWLFGVKVNDRFTSQVSQEDLGLRSFVRIIEEGNNHREQRAEVDRASGFVTITDTDLTRKPPEPKIKTSASPGWVQDFLSAIYYMRTRPLKEGEALAIPISDQGTVYNIEVVPGRREEVTVVAGTFNAVPVEVKMFDGRLVKRSGQLIIWLSDDSGRLPVRAKLKISGTTVTMGLIAVKG